MEKLSFKLKLIILLLVILIISILVVYNTKNKLDPFLQSNYNHQESYDYLKADNIVIYYPLDKKIYKSEAEKILNDIKGEGLIKIDYKYGVSNDMFKTIIYNIYQKDKEVKTIGYSIDSNKQKLDNSLFDEISIRILSDNLRYFIKENNILKITSKLMEETYNNKELFNKFYIDGKYFNFSIKLVNKEFVFKQDISEISNHLLLNLFEKNNEKLLIKHKYIFPNKKTLAITFDDGPHNTYTREILEALNKYDSNATFYVLGTRINDNTKNIILETILSGNEIGNHSFNHEYLPKTRNLDKQFNYVKEKVEEITNNTYKINTFRPPYGSLSKKVKEKSPYPFILWNIDTED